MKYFAYIQYKVDTDISIPFKSSKRVFDFWDKIWQKIKNSDLYTDIRPQKNLGYGYLHLDPKLNDESHFEFNSIHLSL
jgi:hypothetical protein